MTDRSKLILPQRVQREETLEEWMPILLKAGFPTFDEFMKNPDKFRLGRYHMFESMENGDLRDRKDLGKQRYYWKDGKQALPIGQILRIAKDEGYKPEELEVLPYRAKNDSGTGKDVIHCRIYSRIEIQLMGGKVPNV